MKRYSRVLATILTVALVMSSAFFGNAFAISLIAAPSSLALSTVVNERRILSAGIPYFLENVFTSVI